MRCVAPWKSLAAHPVQPVPAPVPRAGTGRGTVSAVQDLSWMVTAFTGRVPAVRHAAVVSADGLPLANSGGFLPERVDQLAVVTSSLASLARGAAGILEGGPVAQMVVEMERGTLIVMAVSDGPAIAALAAAGCDMGLGAYEMALLAEQAGRVLALEARGRSPSQPPGAGTALRGRTCGASGQPRSRPSRRPKARRRAILPFVAALACGSAPLSCAAPLGGSPPFRW